jgi:hypothetical protein
MDRSVPYIYGYCIKKYKDILAIIELGDIIENQVFFVFI